MSLGTKMGWATGAAMVLALAGCNKNKAPSGQVVATVNGEEVTLPELNAEAQAANIPDSADKKQIMPALLQRVIDRKLLAGEAEKRGIDKQAEYLVQRRRADEALLAQLLVKPQLQSSPVPTPAEVGRFMSQNPSMFAQRARYQIDQIRFPRPDDVGRLKALESAHSQADVAATLQRLGVQFERGPTTMDSGSVPPQVMARIAALPAGEPFVIPVGQLVTVNVITGKQPVALPDAQARQLAANMVRQQKSEQLITNQMKTLRDAAKINYQPGYAPPAGAAGAGLPGGAPATGAGAAPAPAGQ